MRDYTGAFPELTMFETWVTTTAHDRPIIQVQAFHKGNRIICPELNCDLYGGNHFNTFDRAKNKLIRDAEQSVKWAQERLDRAHAITEPVESQSRSTSKAIARTQETSP